MRTRTLTTATAAVALFALGIWAGVGGANRSSADSTAIGLMAKLSAGAEVPPPTGARTTAGGVFAAGLTRRGTGGTLAWKLTFHGLTGKASAAHVHFGKAGKAGGVAMPLCGPCRSGAHGSAKVTAPTIRALLGAGAYVNVHTAKNAAGEIRGQVRKGGTPPAPGTTTTTNTDTTTTYDPYP